MIIAMYGSLQSVLCWLENPLSYIFKVKFPGFCFPHPGVEPNTWNISDQYYWVWGDIFKLPLHYLISSLHFSDCVPDTQGRRRVFAVLIVEETSSSLTLEPRISYSLWKFRAYLCWLPRIWSWYGCFFFMLFLFYLWLLFPIRNVLLKRRKLDESKPL